MQRFALLGAGFIGTEHARNLERNPDVDFRLVYDVDARRAEHLAGRHGAHATARLADAFDPEEIDAVFIASSTNTHADHLHAASAAGLAALCEKPIDPDLDRARAVAAYATEQGGRVMVNFNRRFDRDHAELKRIVDSGELGQIELVQISARGPEVPPLQYIAVSGGQMRDQTVHFFDLVRWLTGMDPVEVYAAGEALAEPRLREYDDVDTSVLTLRLPTGALVQIDNTRRTAYGYDERIEVLGSHGMAESGRQRAGNVTRYAGGKIVEDGLPAGWFERIRPTYAAALNHFVESLESHTAITPSLVDGLKAQAIAEAATESLRTRLPQPIRYAD